MIGEESNYEISGKVEDRLRLARPNRGRHRNKVLLDEPPTNSAFAEELADTPPVLQFPARGRGAANSIKPNDVAKQTQERRPQAIAPLGK